MDRKPIKNFDALKQQYLHNLRVTAGELRPLLEKIIFSAEDVVMLQEILHKMAGSGSTFGYPSLSDAASQFGDFLGKESDVGDPRFIQENLRDFFGVLEKNIAEKTAQPVLVSRPIVSVLKKSQHIYLLEDDLDLAGFIAGELYLEDYHVSLFSSVAEINEAVYKLRPAAIVADIILPEGPEAGIDWVKAINLSFKPQIPVVFISEKGDFQTRLDAVKAGANFYLKKPVNIEQLKHALHECIHNKPYDPYRVLLVDDDRLLASVYKLDLGNHGINVRVIADPFEVMAAIEEFKPELILLDLYMPQCSGIELGQVIRQWPEYASIPIVFMSVERDSRTQLDAIRLAGDDFLVKPIEPWQLSVHVLARMKRARMITVYQEQLASEVVHQKRHDLLTGLPNRNFLEEEINKVIASLDNTGIRATALLWMDIDNFSHLNDVLGHKLGDQVIVEVARRLASVLDRDDFLCRIGGDEYALVVNRLAVDLDLSRFCQEVMDLFALPFLIERESYRITISMGVGVYSSEMVSAHELIKSADIALYHAKLNGRNNYVLFSGSMEKQLIRNLWLESELRQAFTGNQLHLVYQPKYSMDGSELIGAEALLRWQHPAAGNVSPDEFIPIAEKSALITDIAYWVLNACCQQIRSWREQGITVPPIAINLSTRDIEDADFIANLIRAPLNHGFDRSNLQIELTERTVAQQGGSTVDTLTRLSALGFSIAIDDFGTGYSSLKYLQSMPISLIKIDRSFIEDIPDNLDNCNITDTIIRLARNMSVDVLAEGVETQAQAKFLESLGCQYLQGYIYSKPLDPEQFRALL